MSLAERWTNLKNLWTRWSNEPGVQLVKVGYERYGMQADLEYFEERMLIEKMHFPIEEVAWPKEGPGSKEDRIERLVPDFMQGKFWLIAAPEKDPEGRDVESTNQRRCREASEVYRILKLVKRRDHEGNLYSLNKNFIEQFMVFPFAPKKDLLDACSRIYDLDPQPPVIIDERDLEPEVFADGPRATRTANELGHRPGPRRRPLRGVAARREGPLHPRAVAVAVRQREGDARPTRNGVRV
jgi:hypothetical protein